MEQLYEVKNPTSEDISIQFKGVVYTLPADGELKNVTQELKEFWNNLHEFLFFAKQKSSVKPEPIKEEVKEDVVTLEEKLEELKEEIKEETVTISAKAFLTDENGIVKEEVVTPIVKEVKIKKVK